MLGRNWLSNNLLTLYEIKAITRIKSENKRVNIKEEDLGPGGGEEDSAGIRLCGILDLRYGSRKRCINFKKMFDKFQRNLKIMLLYLPLTFMQYATEHYTVGWSDLAFSIFENLHISVDQVYF